MKPEAADPKLFYSLRDYAPSLLKDKNPPTLQTIYQDPAGRDEVLVCRYEKNGKKTIIPRFLRNGVPTVGEPKTTGRCLFRSPEIVKNKDATILVFEGEKSAQSSLARELQKNGYIVTTWRGGSGAVHKTDWLFLQGRKIVIWPDKDEPGYKAAHEIKKMLPQARIITPPEVLSENGDIADLDWSVEEVILFLETADELPGENLPAEVETVKILSKPITNGSAAIVLKERLEGIVFDKPTRTFYRKDRDGVCYKEMLAPFTFFMETLQKIISDELQELTESGEFGPREIKELYALAGKDQAKIQSRDFLRQTAGLVGEYATPRTDKGAVPFNETPEALPLLDAVLDLSGKEPVVRAPNAGEYFKDPIPITAENFRAADPDNIPHYDSFMVQLHPDHETRKTAEFANAVIMGNRGAKNIVAHIGPGNSGKDTETELKRELLPGKIGTWPKDMIVLKGNDGVKRFSGSGARGKLGVVVSEMGEYDVLDSAALKGYTNTATLTGEKKGKERFDFKQTAIIIFHSNYAPKFSPDSALLLRFTFIVHPTVFYRDEEERQNKINTGITEAHLHPQKDQEILFPPIIAERAGIIKRWSRLYIELRDKYNRRIPESPACRQAKEAYRKKNDLLEQFFIEYFVRDDLGPGVKNSELEKLWTEFSNKPWKRGTLKTALEEKFDFIKSKRTNAGWYVFGIRVKEAENDEFPF